jgi:hypothetical protein
MAVVRNYEFSEKRKEKFGKCYEKTWRQKPGDLNVNWIRPF